MLLELVLVFMLVLTRISAMVMTTPTMGTQGAPMQVRAIVALGLSVLVTPVQWSVAPPLPPNLLELSIMLLREGLLGLTLGLALLILVSGLQLAGHLAGQLSGMQLAELYDPSFDASSPVTAKLLEMIALAVFFGTGGHQQVMAALLTSFRHIPPGSGAWSESLLTALVEVTQHSFEVGLRAAAPIVLALLLATLLVALIGRTLPQLNILAVGFSLNAFVLFGTLAFTISSAAWLFSGEADTAVAALRDTLEALMPARTPSSGVR